MKIWHISDTHKHHGQLDIPNNIDVVIHSGDCSNPRQPVLSREEIKDFIEWYQSLAHIPYKIYVAGNHDSAIEAGLITIQDFNNAGIIYLENDFVEIKGHKIFGSPLTPTFGEWSFMKPEHKLEQYWNQIPDDTDILITHGPPKSILDLTEDRFDQRYTLQVGSQTLLNRVKELNLKLHLFGHIHNRGRCINSGTKTIPGLQTVFSNGSVVTDKQFGLVSSQGNILNI